MFILGMFILIVAMRSLHHNEWINHVEVLGDQEHKSKNCDLYPYGFEASPGSHLADG